MASLILPVVSQEFALEQWLQNNSGAVSVCLAVNDINPDSATVLGDFTEATFPGYARQPLTINAPELDAPNARSFVGPLPFAFGGPTDASSNSIYAIFVICPGDVSMDLVCAWRVDFAPIVVTEPTDYVASVLTLTAGGEQAPLPGFGIFLPTVSIPAGYDFNTAIEAKICALLPDGSGTDTTYNGDVTLTVSGPGDESTGLVGIGPPAVLTLIDGVWDDSFAMMFSNPISPHDDTFTVTDGVVGSACRCNVFDAT